jgi:hypothetical protein
MNPFLLVCSHHGAGTVVPNPSVARARILTRIKLPNRSSGSKNRHDGHAKLESSPRGFRADFGLRQVRRAAPNAFGDQRSAPTLFAVSTAGRRPARYCESNARRAAATVGPIPTIPSSTLGPSSAIQSSPRKLIEAVARPTGYLDEPYNKTPFVLSLRLSNP